jgi:hypothetical protein
MPGGIHISTSPVRLFPPPLFVARYGTAGFLGLVQGGCEEWQEKRAEETVHARMAPHDLQEEQITRFIAPCLRSGQVDVLPAAMRALTPTNS